MYIETKTGGWLPDQEHLDCEVLMSGRSIGANEIMHSIDPRERYRMENQGQIGSCQGCSLSTTIEEHILRASGRVVQLSKQCAYILSQKIDRISGDRGSTITGGAKVATGQGICTEDLWPYPSRYSARVPAAYAGATKYTLGGYHQLTSYEDMVAHIMDHGPVHIGITWSGDIDRQAGQNAIIETYSGRGGGGHSVPFAGFDHEKRNSDGWPYLWLANSWSERWGDNGWVRVSPRAVTQMARGRGNVFVGFTGGKDPDYQEPGWVERS